LSKIPTDRLLTRDELLLKAQSLLANPSRHMQSKVAVIKLLLENSAGSETTNISPEAALLKARLIAHGEV